MNQKPVDDKELGKLLKHILVDRFSRYDTAEVLIKEMIPALNAYYQKKYEKVDRFEVIDETGRAYVKGSIYGSPVKIELSLQDEGRTLKVFVEALANMEGE